MQLPEKTFLQKPCQLFESDFDCNHRAKPLRIMQLLQDAATDHALQLNVGWDNLNAHGIFWILAKIKIDFCTPVTRKTRNFTLYTWPLAPRRAFAERCFCATDGTNQLFCATSMWTLVGKDDRKIYPAEKMNEFFHGEYSSVHSDTTADFARVRLDETFSLHHEITVRRSDLDLNFHVNNTNYVTYAVDVLPPQTEIVGLELCYHKELKFGDVVQIYSKTQQNAVQVVGVRNDETCFTALLKTA